MTLVVTTVSRWGITVVGDRAETNEALGPEKVFATPEARKVFFAKRLRVSLAFWGNAQWPGGDYDEWILNGLMPELERTASLRDIAQHVCDRVNDGMLELGGNFEKLRRGVHVAGFIDGLPHLYHCHMGEHPPKPQSAMQVHKDYPDIHGGGLEAYRARIKNGLPGQLRNGRHDLFNFIGESLEGLRESFEQLYKTPLPEPSLQGQLYFDIALVRFAAGLMRAAGKVPTVSDAVDWYAFDSAGEFSSSDNEPLIIGKKLENPYLGLPNHASTSTATPFPLMTSADRQTDEDPESR